MIEDILKTRRAEEWLQDLHKAGIPAGPVNTLDRALVDPHVLSRDMVVEIDTPEGGRTKTIGNPLKMEGTPLNLFRRSPRLGEHTREILSTILGYSPERIEELTQKGVIKTA